MLRRLTASPLTTLLALALGLTLGLAGTAIANRPSQPTSTQKLTKGQVKKLVRKEIAKAAPTLSVAHAGSADTATTATNAAKVGGLLPSDLVRATTATAGSLTAPCAAGVVLNDFSSGTFTNVVSKVVAAPVAGVLVVMGTVEAGSDNNPVPPAAAESNWATRITVDGTQAGGVSNMGTDGDFAAAACGDADTVQLSAAVPVTAGSHTVATQISFLGGGRPLFVGYGSVTTIFVPFGNAGTQGVVDKSHDAAVAGTN